MTQIIHEALRQRNSPRGVWIAVLGPDGSGKTSVINQLLDEFTREGRKSALYLHFRPHFFQADAQALPVTDPHGRPPRGPLLSALKLLYYLLDFSLGYALKVRPALGRNRLVVFDRYYDDILVDPARYRYGGSPHWVRAIGALVPRPHLTVVLDAPVEILQMRKMEVAPEACAEARAGYLALAATLPCTLVVDAARPIEHVVAEVRALVVQQLAGRALQP